MILDNIKKIIRLLNFREDVFYYLEILQRKKDNSNITKDRKIYQRYVTSLKELYEILDDIKLLCKVYNARAYFSLIPRSSEKFAKECLRALTDKVCSNNFKNTFLIPDKVVLLPQTTTQDKVWILDVDVKDEDYIDDFVRMFEEKLSTRIIETLDTINGYHVIVNPFNLRHENLIDLKDDNYRVDKFEFTLRREALTIFYADIS